ncbi:hypothetical protein Ae201684_016730 [Aphanomyces euteiches]|uniref:Sugar phosphate transporter domain-containing protein n=1 Tax=Aphanomyces euteiches TaxID=100861 RepID=A0A6G0WE52_9STRA|nr:hypothetical protein Ae201684_016730 [Aphanomyces euteiches]
MDKHEASAKATAIMQLQASQPSASSYGSVPLFYMCVFLSLLAMSLLALKLMLQRQASSTSRLPPSTRRIVHGLDVAMYILAWYAMSITMTLFNKWFIKVWRGGFSFVFTIGCVHMTVKSILSRIVHWRHRRSIAPIASVNYWRLCVPIGLFTGADIVMSNMSLEYITVSFFTIVKSGGNVWNLLFSILLGLQKPTVPLLVVVVVICFGIGLASYGTIHFVLFGFLLVLFASILGTLRWVLTQFLMHRMDASQNKALSVVYHIAPMSALSLLPIALLVEGKALSQSVFVQTPALWGECILFLIAGGILSFLLIYVEVELVKKTSALSLGIAGNLKDVMQILMAMLVFHDQLSAINAAGLCIATLGLMSYSYLKATAAASKAEAGTSPPPPIVMDEYVIVAQVEKDRPEDYNDDDELEPHET